MKPADAELAVNLQAVVHVEHDVLDDNGLESGQLERDLVRSERKKADGVAPPPGSSPRSERRRCSYLLIVTVTPGSSAPL